MQKTKRRQKGPMVQDSTAVGGVADATGDRQGPMAKDSTVAGGIANATGDRKGPIPSIVIGGLREIDRVRFPPSSKSKKRRLTRSLLFLERATGIEPARSAWEAEVLPLNYARI